MKLFRVLLMCLVAFALPVQGFAAASKALCQHGMPMPSAVVILQEQHQHHEVMVMTQDDCHHGMHTSKDVGVKHQDHKCSSCAQCGLGASMVGATPERFVAPLGMPVQVEGMRVLQSEVTLDSLERPPQSFCS